MVVHKFSCINVRLVECFGVTLLCSNLYRDSEGTLGHEFYEEEILVDEQTGTVRRGMKRITENLTPEASSINSNKQHFYY